MGVLPMSDGIIPVMGVSKHLFFPRVDLAAVAGVSATVLFLPRVDLAVAADGVSRLEVSARTLLALVAFLADCLTGASFSLAALGWRPPRFLTVLAIAVLASMICGSISERTFSTTWEMASDNTVGFDP